MDIRTFVIGAGGLGQEVASALKNHKNYQFAGYFDDKYKEHFNGSYHTQNGSSVMEPAEEFVKSGYRSAQNVIKQAKTLRDIPTKQEKKLWEEIRDEKLGINFINKFPIDNMIVDFYSPTAKLIVQINDGLSPNLYNNNYIRGKGIKILRFHTYEVDKYIDKLKYRIKQMATVTANEQNLHNGYASRKFNLDSINSTDYINALIAIADPRIKENIVRRIINPSVMYPKFVHDLASIEESHSVNMGEGAVVLSGARLTCNITLGDHVMINLNATVGHDTEIGSFCSIMPGAHISGGVTIGANTLVGSGAVILQGLKIGEGAKVGAGAVVTKNVNPGETVVGVPAKIIP